MIGEYISIGKIVPVDITCQLLKKAMEKNGWAAKKFLIDGFPRNQDNFDGWERVIGDSVEVPFIVFMEADEDTMIARIMDRSKTSDRDDDNIEVLKNRFAIFKGETMPIVNVYEKLGKCRRINGLQAIDVVF